MPHSHQNNTTNNQSIKELSWSFIKLFPLAIQKCMKNILNWMSTVFLVGVLAEILNICYKKEIWAVTIYKFIHFKDDWVFGEILKDKCWTTLKYLWHGKFCPFLLANFVQVRSSINMSDANICAKIAVNPGHYFPTLSFDGIHDVLYLEDMTCHLCLQTSSK